jgi:hypothetical protein
MAQGSVAQWLGNVAQWVGALLTAFGIFFALFKEEILGWFWPPELLAEIKAEHPYCVRTGAHETSPEKWDGSQYWIRIVVKHEGESTSRLTEITQIETLA